MFCLDGRDKPRKRSRAPILDEGQGWWLSYSKFLISVLSPNLDDVVNERVKRARTLHEFTGIVGSNGVPTLDDVSAYRGHRDAA